MDVTEVLNDLVRRVPDEFQEYNINDSAHFKKFKNKNSPSACFTVSIIRRESLFCMKAASFST